MGELEDIKWLSVADRYLLDIHPFLSFLHQPIHSFFRFPFLSVLTMRYTSLFTAAVAAFTTTASAISVSGSAEGFAKGVTGGGDATPVYPSSTDELVSYLSDDEARVIVLSKTFDFTGTEGTTTSTGCAPWGTGSACQLAINSNDWCTNYQPDAPSVSVKYDNAGTLGITVTSDKTIIGEGSKGIIKGKGLRIVSGASNIIIQ